MLGPPLLPKPSRPPSLEGVLARKPAESQLPCKPVSCKDLNRKAEALFLFEGLAGKLCFSSHCVRLRGEHPLQLCTEASTWMQLELHCFKIL